MFRQSSTLALAVLLVACAKKAPKPVHTAPWLAHPTASAEASADAGATSVPFHLSAGSTLEFELYAKQARWRGAVTTLSGNVDLNLMTPSATRAHFSADLSSLVMHGAQGGDAAATDRAARALEISADGGSEGLRSATFELSALTDLSPPNLAPRRERGDAGPGERRLHAIAIGDLTLHGFRASERVPIEAEVGFSAVGEPVSLVIRSRAPLVITLGTHQIAPGGSEPLPREARVTFEFHLEK